MKKTKAKRAFGALLKEERRKVRADASQLAMRLRAENVRLREDWRAGWSLTRDALCTLRELFLPFENGKARPLDEAEALRRVIYVGEAHRRAEPPSDDPAIRQPASVEAPAAPLSRRHGGGK